LLIVLLVGIVGFAAIVGIVNDKITLNAHLTEVERITLERTREITRMMGGSVEADQTACDRTPTKRKYNREPYYTGPLIDTHVHMPVASSTFSEMAIQSGFEDMPHTGQVPTSKIVCLMEKEGITKTFGFFLAPNLGLSQAVDHVRAIDVRYPGKFVKFFMPPLPMQSLFPKKSDVIAVFSDSLGLYQGYGELRFDFNLGQNVNPEDEYLLEMYALSDKHNLIVQIHPDKGQLPLLKRLLEKYPNVIFLAHVMRDVRQEIGELMKTHKNLYYSLDAEITSLFGYHIIQDNRGPTKKEFLDMMDEKFGLLLAEGLDSWKELIEAHPNQFTWGSDRWFTWHFDEDVGAVLEEFGRSFIGRLDPAVRENFAYKNAERMLAER
jgi:hypothetical protein